MAMALQCKMNSDTYSNFIFNGCSLTFGYGLADSDRTYGQLVSEHFFAKYKNISVPGTDNYSIFVSTLEEIGKTTDAVVFVQWTWLNRKSVFLHPNNEPECSFTTHYAAADVMKMPIGDWLQTQGFTLNDVATFLKYHTLFSSEHKLCHEIFRYTDIIAEYARTKNIIPIFINVGIPEYITNFLSSETTSATSDLPDSIKKLLCFDTTSDSVIKSYIDKWKTTLNDTNWVNFNKPWIRWVDLALDKSHPGPLAHRGLADDIVKYLEVIGPILLTSVYDIARIY